MIVPERRLDYVSNRGFNTHMPNLARAFPAWDGAAEGEAVILRPDGKGGTELVGRIKIEDWPRLPH